MQFFDNDPNEDGFQFLLDRGLSETELVGLPEELDYEQDEWEGAIERAWINGGNEVKAATMAYLAGLPA